MGEDQLMQKLLDFIHEAQTIFVAVLAGLIWLLRLESRIALHTAALDQMQRQRANDLEAAADLRAADLKAAADARRDTADMLREMRGDIKTLLERGVK